MHFESSHRSCSSFLAIISSTSSSRGWVMPAGGCWSGGRLAGVSDAIRRPSLHFDLTGPSRVHFVYLPYTTQHMMTGDGCESDASLGTRHSALGCDDWRWLRVRCLPRHSALGCDDWRWLRVRCPRHQTGARWRCAGTRHSALGCCVRQVPGAPAAGRSKVHQGSCRAAGQLTTL